MEVTFSSVPATKDNQGELLMPEHKEIMFVVEHGSRQIVDHCQAIPGVISIGADDDEDKTIISLQFSRELSEEDIKNILDGIPKDHIKNQKDAEGIIQADAESEKWYDKLDPDEVVHSDGQVFPKLVGLRKLAKDLVYSEKVTINFVGMVEREVRRELKEYEFDENGNRRVVRSREEIGRDFLPYASVTYSVNLVDGRTFSDSADAYLGNCNELGNYPTAVATARAEGRTLRKVLGIKEHTFEELSDKTAAEELISGEDTPIANEQKKLLEKMLGKSDITLAQLLGNIDTSLTNLDQMTSAQAKNALRYLNDQKKKVSRKK